MFMGHTGHSAVPAAAAFSDGPDRALLARVAANEVAGRLGAALFLGPHNGQFWAAIHCASAAVAASVGIGLDAGRTAHALAIALYQPPYGMWPGFMGPGSKLLTAAEPAAAGARAALLAADGVTGAIDVIEHPRGVLANLSFAPRPAMFGDPASGADTLAFKRLPGCAYLQSIAEAACAAEVEAEAVAEIKVEAGWLTCEMESLGDGPDLSPVRVNFSARLSTAIALLAGRLTPTELDPSWLREHEGEIRDLAARVSLRHDPALTAQTLLGTLEAGASADDVGLRDLLRIRRRLGDINMDGANPGPALLSAVRAEPRLRRALAQSLRARLGGPTAAGIDELDVEALRMTFPSRMRIRLCDGAVVRIEGTSPHPAAGPSRSSAWSSTRSSRSPVEQFAALSVGWSRKRRTASTRRWSSLLAGRSSLLKMLVTCFSTARSVTTSSAAIAALERPSAIRPSTSRSRGVSASSGSSRRRLRPSIWETTSGSSAEPPAPTRRTASVSASTSRDPVLEQVAEPLGALGQQLAGVGDLDVLGEHEHPDVGQLGADLARRPQALVGVGRRHPHVDDGDVGLVGADLAQQLLGVARLADDLEPRLLQQPHQALAQQGRIVGDDYSHGYARAHGIRARTSSAAGGADHLELARRAPRPGRRAPAGRCPPRGRRHRRRRRATSTSTTPLLRSTRTVAQLGLGVAGDVGQRLGDHEVGRRLDRRRQPLARGREDLDRDRRAVGEASERGAEAAVGEHDGVDAAGQLAQLGGRRRQLLHRLVEQLGGRVRVVVEPVPRASRRFIVSAISRCWAPSWRSRSTRRRSA